MESRRNLLPLGGLLLGVVGIITYFTVVNSLVAPRIPFLRDFPVANLAIVGVALWLSFAGVRRAFSGQAYRGKVLAPVLAAINVTLAGFFGWYLFDYSYRLPSGTAVPDVGDVAPDFALADEDGHPVRLASLRGKNTLLVFYRGHW